MEVSKKLWTLVAKLPRYATASVSDLFKWPNNLCNKKSPSSFWRLLFYHVVAWLSVTLEGRDAQSIHICCLESPKAAQQGIWAEQTWLPRVFLSLDHIENHAVMWQNSKVCPQGSRVGPKLAVAFWEGVWKALASPVMSWQDGTFLKTPMSSLAHSWKTISSPVSKCDTQVKWKQPLGILWGNRIKSYTSILSAILDVWPATLLHHLSV